MNSLTNEESSIEPSAHQPAGPLQPGIEYLFNFEVREGMSQKNIANASFNFDVVKDGAVIDTTSSTGTLTKTISFEEPGLVNLLLTDVNSSPQQVDFTFPVGNEKSSKNGISFAMKNYNAEPKIFFCGSAKDLETRMKKEHKGDVGWFGKVTVMIYAPGWNVDSDKRDRIGATTESALTITSRGDGSGNAELGVCNDSDSEGLIETDPNSAFLLPSPREVIVNADSAVAPILSRFSESTFHPGAYIMIVFLPHQLVSPVISLSKQVARSLALPQKKIFGSAL